MKSKLIIVVLFIALSLGCAWSGVSHDLALAFFSAFSLLVLGVKLVKNRNGKRGFFLYPHFFKQQAYNYLMLVGLFLLLCFLEVSNSRAFSNEGLRVKFIGLFCLLFLSIFLKFIPKKFQGLSTLLIIFFSGVLVSFSCAQMPGVIAVLPLISIGILVVTMSWSFAYQIEALTLLLIQDLLLKKYLQIPLSFEFSILAGSFSLMAFVAFVSEGSFSTQYGRSFFKDKDENHIQGKKTKKFKRMFLQFILQEEPSKKERLTIGILIAGLISCIISSRVLYKIAPLNNWPVVLTWLAFFSLWASATYLEKTEKKVELFWSYSALVSILILLWPCALLISVKNIGSFWLFWPSCIFFSIGTVPWRSKELIPQLIVFAVVGAELISTHSLGLPGISIFLISAITSVLFSLRTSRGIREKEYLLKFPKFLQSCESSSDVVKILALHMMGLFSSSFSMYRIDESKANILFGSNIFDEFLGQWPTEAYAKNLDELSERSSNIEVFRSNERLEIEVENRGFLKAQSFFGMTLHSSEKIEYIFPLSIPLVPYLRSNELAIANSLAQIASSKITELVSESRLKEMGKSFNDAEQSREFELSSLVHDINNTVQDLTILSDSLLEDNSDSEKEQRVAKISAIARSVATVVSDAKRRREIDSQTEFQASNEIDILKVLKELLEYAEVRAEQRGINFESKLDGNESIFVKVSSREHLETILRNILNNAIGYSSSGDTVEVSLEHSQDKINVVVKDEGIGLSESEKSNIFIPGFRSETAVKRASGLGIGLAQAKSFVESSGGSISVFSAGKSKGSTFTLSFPTTSRKEISSQASWALAIDDQLSVLALYEKVLSSFSLEVCKASSVSKAKEFLELKGAPDFVIADINLGTENGLDLVKYLRARFGSCIPVIVISGMPREKASINARAAGASDYIAKPVRASALTARVESLLSEYLEYLELKNG